MAIVSLVCGIVGLCILIACNSFYFYDGENFRYYYSCLIDFALILSIPFALILLSFIFGIIGRRKGKNTKYYRTANASFIIGLIGLTVQFVPPVVSYAVDKILPRPPHRSVQRPVYSIYSGIGSITTRTRDEQNYTVTVIMKLMFDLDDTVTSSELASKQMELRNFVQAYFARKYAFELEPENEEQLKADIKEILNTRFLDKGRVRRIIFDKFDVEECNE
jgi:flagellar basal body-associated protein FliL